MGLGIVDEPIRMIFTQTAADRRGGQRLSALHDPADLCRRHAARFPGVCSDAAATPRRLACRDVFVRVILPLVCRAWWRASPWCVLAFGLRLRVPTPCSSGERYPTSPPPSPRPFLLARDPVFWRRGRRGCCSPSAGSPSSRGAPGSVAGRPSDERARGDRIRLGEWPSGAAAVFLLAPLLVIAAASFSPTPVFDHCRSMAHRCAGIAASARLDGFWPALSLSLQIALLSTMIALVLGTSAAIAIVRGKLPGANHTRKS